MPNSSPHTHRRTLLAFAVLLASLAPLFRSAGAQAAVSGAVRGSPGNAPIVGAIVILVGATGSKLGGTLTDDAGRYRLNLAEPGSYSLRVDLVGYRSTLVPAFEVRGADTVTRDITFMMERIALPTIAVTASSACTAVSGDAGDAPRLWNEARKALEATRIAQDEQRFSVSMRRFERTVALPDSVVRDSRSYTQNGVTRNPFVSLSPDSIARLGYMIGRDSLRLFYAPDAHVLLSDAFVNSHCFATRRGGTAGAIGLSFRPQRASRRVDVEGTLWLDSASAELRTLEFRYTPSLARQSLGGGTVDFGKYPSGVWGVQRWTIRLPVLRIFESRRRPDGALGRFVDTVVTAYREEGGEVLTGVTATTQATGAGTRVTGFVFDSTTAAGMPGAIVTIEGLGRTARTDSLGRFAFDSLADPGEYRIRFWHPRLDSLGAGMPRAPVRIRRGAAVEVPLGVPSVASLGRGRCPAASGPPARLISGTVASAGSGPAAGAEVVLLERRSAAGGDSLLRFSDVTSEAGRFVFCNAASGSQLWLAVRAGGAWSPSVHVPDSAVVSASVVPLRAPSAGTEARQDTALAVAPPTTLLGRVIGASTEGELRGWVLFPDAAPTGSGAAQVLVDDIVRAQVRGDGTFRVSPVAEGPRRISVRAAGHVVTRFATTVANGQSQLVLVTLAPAPATMVVQGKATPPQESRIAEFRQRKKSGDGVFLERADIVKRNARTLADVLRGVPGVRVQFGNGGYRYVTTHFRKLGTASTSDDGETCEMMFYVDGQPFPMENGSVDTRIRVTEIDAMEIYVSAGSVPRRFAGPNAACGVVVIWRG